MSAFSDAVAGVVAALHPGDVVSYGDVAAEAGAPGAARAVGRVLQDRDGLPWWRVVAVSGRLAPGLEAEQARLLGDEGVTVRRNRVVVHPPPGNRGRPSETEAAGGGEQSASGVRRDTAATQRPTPARRARRPSG